MPSLWQGKLLLSLEDLYRFSQPLKNLTWFVAVNDTPTPFWTSDNPVIYRDCRDAGLSWDFAGEGTEVLFPLSKRLMLVLRDKTYFPKEIGRDRRCVAFTEEDVVGSNYNQTLCCSRQVYSPSDEFACALDLCREHPEICIPDAEYILELIARQT
jgi:hypothetical protein